MCKRLRIQKKFVLVAKTPSLFRERQETFLPSQNSKQQVVRNQFFYEKHNVALSWIAFSNTSYLFWVSMFICVFADLVVFEVLQIYEWTALQPVYDEEHNVALSWQFAVGACWHTGRLAEELNWFARPLSSWPWFAFCGKREICKIKCCDRVMYWIVGDKNCLGQGARMAL